MLLCPAMQSKTPLAKSLGLVARGSLFSHHYYTTSYPPTMPPSPASARNALAALPRSLRISPSTPITRTHLLALYREELRVAHSFPSYNFKQYFLRRTRDKYRSELPALLDGHYSSSSSAKAKASGSTTLTASEEDAPPSIYSPSKTATASATTTNDAASTTPETRLREWYAQSLSELAVMARAAIVNRMYEAPRLVVEGVGRVMATGGGGAGAEAAYVVSFPTARVTCARSGDVVSERVLEPARLPVVTRVVRRFALPSITSSFADPVGMEPLLSGTDMVVEECQRVQRTSKDLRHGIECDSWCDEGRARAEWRGCRDRRRRLFEIECTR